MSEKQRENAQRERERERERMLFKSWKEFTIQLFISIT
jgi:hypothetical protein